MGNYKFVRIRCDHYNIEYKEWFWLIEPDMEISFEDTQIIGDRLQNLAISQFWDHGVPGRIAQENSELALSVASRTTAMSALYLFPSRDRTWLVRESGSYMPFDPETNTILQEFESETFSFPRDDFDVLVCENDPTNKYIKGWRNIFSCQKVSSMNNFRHQTADAIANAVVSAKTIAFHTQFADFDWWEMLVQAWLETGSKAQVYGYCHDKKRWKEAMKIKPPGMSVVHIDFNKLAYKG